MEGVLHKHVALSLTLFKQSLETKIVNDTQDVGAKMHLHRGPTTLQFLSKFYFALIYS